MPFKIHTVHQLRLSQGKENLFQCSKNVFCFFVCVKEAVNSIRDYLIDVTGTINHVKFH